MESLIEKLKSKLENYKTEDVLGYISTQLLPKGIEGEDISDSSDIFQKTILHSPMKQYLYLAGLLVSTDYNKNSKEILTGHSCKELEKDVQRITDKYLDSISQDLFNNRTENDDEKNNLYSAFEAFDSYFNTGLLNYTEQVEDRIKMFFLHFNSKIENIFGVNTDDMLDFYHLVFDGVQKSLDKMYDTIQSVDNYCKEESFISKKDAKCQSQKFAESIGLIDAFSKVNTISKNEIVSKFGTSKATKLLELFVVERNSKSFRYYAFDNNPFVEKPLVWINQDRFFVTYPAFLLNQIYVLLNNCLVNDPKFVKFKGDMVESLTASIFQKLLGNNAKIFKNVCEKPGTDEHDLLILLNKYIFIVEVKGSKVKTPRKNLEKSAIYLKEHFFGPSGIGYAYNQAIKLKEFFDGNSKVNIYVDMDKAMSLDVSNKKILPIVITLEQFGKIEINTSTMIKPKKGQPYPWVCCIDDLENIQKVNEYLEISPEKFINYLEFRKKWHRNIFASDELELLEDFYANKLKGMKKDTNYFFEPRGKSLVDKIYFEKHGAIYQYDYKKSSN